MPSPDYRSAGTANVARQLDQDAAELAPLEKQVVRPLDLHAADAQPLERSCGAYRHGEAQAAQGARALRKAPQYRESKAAADAGHPEIPPPAASGALVLANQDGAVRGTRRSALGEQGIGRGAFIEHLEAKLRGDFPQARREDIGFDQIGIFRKPKSATAHLQYLQVEIFEPAHEVQDAGAGNAQRLAKTLAGMKSPVGQNAKQRKAGVSHARGGGEKSGEV